MESINSSGLSVTHNDQGVPRGQEMPVPSQGHYGFHSFPVVD
jgi:hypothetical protein